MLCRDSDFGIRRYRREDAGVLYAAARESVDDVYPWMSWCHPRFSLDDATGFVASRKKAWEEAIEYSFAIVDARRGGYVGGVGLNRIDREHGLANMAYWVRSSWKGRGAATAGARLAASYGFESLGLRRIEVVASVEQKASHRIAERLGARREGVLRARFVLHGCSHDAVLYSLLPADLSGSRP